MVYQSRLGSNSIAGVGICSYTCNVKCGNMFHSSSFSGDWAVLKKTNSFFINLIDLVMTCFLSEVMDFIFYSYDNPPMIFNQKKKNLSRGL